MDNYELSLQNDYQVQRILALESALLSIYDEIIITNNEGKIHSISGGIDSLWPLSNKEMVGENIFQLEELTFLDDSTLKELSRLDSYRQTELFTTWNNESILITCYLSYFDNKDILTWCIKNISEKLYVEEKNKLSNGDIQALSKFLVIQSDQMMEVFKTVKMVAKVPTTTLILGDSGVGKEIIAKAIHGLGLRKDKPFVAVNCGAIPENLLESELFGYVDGAFSGATKGGATGKFELANGGILFLDEIGEMPLNLQVKLLRVLQEKEVNPLGSSGPIKLDVQIIAATNKSLENLVSTGEFREDLYYRLNVIPINIPSLKERVEEIPYFVHYFCQKYNALYNKNIIFLPDAIELLTIYDWPGNVRELENFIERIVVTNQEDAVDARSIKDQLSWKKVSNNISPIIENIMPLQDAIDLVEERLITLAMKQYKSLNLSAKVLEISQPTMSRKYKKIRDKQKLNKQTAISNRKEIENQLNKQLRSVSIVTAAIIHAEDIIRLKMNLTKENSAYKELKGKLTQIEQLEGGIEHVFIVDYVGNNTMYSLVANEGYPLRPGETYKCDSAVMKSVNSALDGNVTVTPLYKDKFGEWRTCFAPILNESGEIVALVGYDYTKAYVIKELKRLGRIFNQ